MSIFFFQKKAFLKLSSHNTWKTRCDKWKYFDSRPNLWTIEYFGFLQRFSMGIRGISTNMFRCLYTFEQGFGWNAQCWKSTLFLDPKPIKNALKKSFIQDWNMNGFPVTLGNPHGYLEFFTYISKKNCFQTSNFILLVVWSK